MPHFYVSVDINLEQLLPLRERLNAQAPKDKEGKPAWKVSVNDFIIKAFAMALVKVPEANVSWTEAAMVHHKHADIGVAVSIPGGLITPVIRDANLLDITSLNGQWKDLVGKVRVTSEGPPPRPASAPEWMRTRFEFQARGDRGPVTLHWYEGATTPPAEIAAEIPMNGSLFVGEKGRIAIAHDPDSLHPTVDSRGM